MTDTTRPPATPTTDPIEVLAALPTAVLRLDHDGRVQWANRAAQRALGPAGAAAGALAARAFGSDQPLADSTVQQAAHTGHWLRIHRVEQADGALVTLEAAQAEVAAQAAAARDRELLGLAQEHGRLGVWQQDIASLRGEWDRHVLGVWGLPRTAGAPDYRVALASVVPEDRDALDRQFRASLTDPGAHEQRFRVRRADGLVRHLHLRWLVKANVEGRPDRALGVLVDDTEARAGVRARSEVESMLALAEETAGIARWVRDLRTERMYYNQHACDMIGLPSRPEGMPSSEFRVNVHPDDLPALLAAGDRTLSTGETTDVEARYRHPSGGWRRVLTRRVLQCDEAGAPVALLGIAIDLSARHEADLALRRADERAALAARGVGLGTWEIDTASGQVHWDAQMWRLRGREPEPDAPDRGRILAMVHPDDQARAAPMYDRVVDGTERTEHAFRVVWPDGSVRWIASRSGPIVDATGRVQRRLGVNWDVTAARGADEERRARELAQQASRAKSEFLARMSHELRTPLNAVIGFSQLLLERHPRADDPERPQLAAVLGAGRHLLALINDVLALTALDDGAFRLARLPVDLPALVREALVLVEPMRQAQGLPPIGADLRQAVAEADPIRLRQALMNLLGNAIKYNVPGGGVRVSTGVDAGVATISVADTGRGLSAAQLAHLFEPFNRLGIDAQGIEGSGIGLTISKALVERMGGTLSVASRLGVGSEFTIRLPVGATDAPAPAHAVAGAAGHARGTVLCVEDNAANMMLLREILALVGGLTVHEATDGAAGIATAIAQRPDLLLLDMQLPDTDGHAVLRRLQADPATAGVRCIAVSANAMPDDVERARRAGFVDYWTKPLDVQRTVEALRRHLAAP